MGKGDDPNCAVGTAMPLPEIGSEEVLLPPVTDRVRVKRVSEGFFLVGYEPGSKRGALNRRQSFFVDADSYAAISTAPDPVAEALGGKEVVAYLPVNPDRDPRKVAYVMSGDDLYEDAAKVVAEGRFDPDNLLRLDGWNNFYQPGGERPISQVYRLEMWSTQADLREMMQRLEGNPFVRSAEIARNPVGLNHQISGTEHLYLEMQLPQDLHDRLWDLRRESKETFCRSDLEGLLRYEYLYEKLPEDIRQLFNLDGTHRELPEPDLDEFDDPDY